MNIQDRRNAETAASPPIPAVATFLNQDLGSPRRRGSIKRLANGWEVTAGGVDIWGSSDEGHFVYRPEPGDFDIAVRVERFAAPHLYSKAGLMIRESLSADSAHLMFLVFGNDAPRNNNLGAYELQFRSLPGADCQGVYPAVRLPAPPEFPANFPNSWLRVRRRGQVFTAFASTDGRQWKVYGEQRLNLASVVQVGPALTSHDPDVIATANFCDFGPLR